MSTGRERISVLADELGIPFVSLFKLICRQFPQAVATDVTVSCSFADMLREFCGTPEVSPRSVA